MKKTHPFASSLRCIAIALLACATSAFAQEYLDIPAKPGVGSGQGKRIVLVAGDEEYRTEESCPMLAKILSQKHGFHCTVLFSTDPQAGYVDPNNQKNIRGTAVLDSADLLIIGTRFRQLPDDQLAPFARFLNAGKPVIGFRTATHAFSGNAKTGDFKWSEFGLKILGEKWVNHHGAHKKEGTRSVVVTSNGSHEVLRGVGEIFATTDVYGIANLDHVRDDPAARRGDGVARSGIEGGRRKKERPDDAAGLAARVHGAERHGERKGILHDARRVGGLCG